MDHVTPEQVSEIVLRAEESLRRVEPPTVTFHLPVVRPEAIYLPAYPSDPIIEIRRQVRHAITQVAGLDLDDAKDYHPHVSIAYSNSSQDTSKVVAALTRATDAVPATATLTHVDLLEFHRDRRMYEWASTAPIRIGEVSSTRN